MAISSRLPSIRIEHAENGLRRATRSDAASVAVAYFRSKQVTRTAHDESSVSRRN